ncbi:hypothetical protein DFH09DRAFT_1336389 [Mycena vulgaris]|nr:hypothetical protein DFH09DRAFT_1336389 [Mycena vulgaris]
MSQTWDIGGPVAKTILGCCTRLVGTVPGRRRRGCIHGRAEDVNLVVHTIALFAHRYHDPVQRHPRMFSIAAGFIDSMFLHPNSLSDSRASASDARWHLVRFAIFAPQDRTAVEYSLCLHRGRHPTYTKLHEDSAVCSHLPYLYAVDSRSDNRNLLTRPRSPRRHAATKQTIFSVCNPVLDVTTCILPVYLKLFRLADAQIRAIPPIVIFERPGALSVSSRLQTCIVTDYLTALQMNFRFCIEIHIESIFPSIV